MRKKDIKPIEELTKTYEDFERRNKTQSVTKKEFEANLAKLAKQPKKKKT